MAEQEVEWIEVGEDFGRAWPHGSCNAKAGVHLDGHPRVCGFPRREDGTCTGGHPAQPPKKPT